MPVKSCMSLVAILLSTRCLQQRLAACKKNKKEIQGREKDSKRQQSKSSRLTTVVDSNRSEKVVEMMAVCVPIEQSNGSSTIFVAEEGEEEEQVEAEVGGEVAVKEGKQGTPMKMGEINKQNVSNTKQSKAENMNPTKRGLVLPVPPMPRVVASSQQLQVNQIRKVLTQTMKTDSKFRTLIAHLKAKIQTEDGSSDTISKYLFVVFVKTVATKYAKLKSKSKLNPVLSVTRETLNAVWEACATSANQDTTVRVLPYVVVERWMQLQQTA